MENVINVNLSYYKSYIWNTVFCKSYKNKIRKKLINLK